MLLFSHPRSPSRSGPRFASWALAALASSLAVIGCFSSTSPTGSNGIARTPSAQAYVHQVQPILQANCYRCHGGLNHRGGLMLDTPAAILHGGKDGPVLVPGHPEQSLLITLIRHQGPPQNPRPMPPKSKLSDADIATITAWVQSGADVPR